MSRCAYEAECGWAKWLADVGATQGCKKKMHRQKTLEGQPVNCGRVDQMHPVDLGTYGPQIHEETVVFGKMNGYTGQADA